MVSFNDLESKKVVQVVVEKRRSNMDSAYEESILRDQLKMLKGEQLKRIIRDVQKCNSKVKISGNKNTLVDRIADALIKFTSTDATDHANTIVNSMNMNSSGSYQWTLQQNKVTLVTRQPMTAFLPSLTGSSASPCINNVPVTAAYKYGPFFKVIDELSPPSLCQSALHGRSTKTFSFTLNPTQQQQINNHTHEVRFFCAKYRRDNVLALMEFPDVCEIRVNGKSVITAQQLRGIKNKPGTINPPDLTKFIQKTTSNTVELVYAHSVHEHVACVRLVRRHTVEALVKNLVDEKFVPKDQVLEKFVKEQQEADVMIEFQTVSMKCPLAFTRIQTPCRASTCLHAQCFDAYTFLKMNEQTPTWSCPACSRSIGSYDDLLVDGYFQNILDTVGANVESVRISADGQIQYIKEDPDEPESRESSPDTQVKREPSIPGAATITILDEGDETEQEFRGVKRTAEEQISPGTSSRPRTNPAVIDLTLSDDEDDEEVEECGNQSRIGTEQTALLTSTQPRLVLLPPAPASSTQSNPSPSYA